MSTNASPTRVRWLVFVLACATSWLLYVHRYAWGVIKADLKAEYGFTDTQLGWLDSAFSATYALFQIPCGHMGDVLGPALALPVGLKPAMRISSIINSIPVRVTC